MEINKEEVTFILSIIATVISIFLAILRIQDSRKKAKRKYSIEANIIPPFSFIEVKIFNRGYRPITIIGFEVYYGNEFVKKIVFTKDIERPIKLLESDSHNLRINKEEIIKYKNSKNIKQEYSCELWIKLLFSTKEDPITKINISEEIIDKDVYIKALRYVSADLFLGFEQMESKFEYFRGKSSLSSGKH